MKYYELTYLISPNISEEEVKNTQQKLDSFIQDKGGLLDSSIPAEKIELSYKMKGNSQAYLVTTTFHLKSESVAELEKEINSQKNIIRFLLYNRKKPQVIEKEKKPTFRKHPPKKKAELKDIEKKLDEILD